MTDDLFETMMAENGFDVTAERSIVYVREADRASLPDGLQDAPGKLFTMHDPEGKCLAVTQDRKIAFALARQNDLTPVSVH